MRTVMQPIRDTLIKHSFGTQRVFERLGSLIDPAGVAIGVLDSNGCFPPGLCTIPMHRNEGCCVSKIDDDG
jgi:hypothetical protein